MILLLQANPSAIASVSDLQLIAPELILTVCACIALVMEVILPYKKSKWTAYFALAGIGLAAVSLGLLWSANQSVLPLDGFYGMVRIDGFALLFKAIFLLYGMSLLYGIAGSTNIGEIGRTVGSVLGLINNREATDALKGLRPMLLLGMIALAAGMFFKISAVPFHMWAPDAYEGAPTSVTAFLSTGSKAASFALYARIFIVALGGMRVDWAPLLGLVAAITIFVGNWGAVTQENSKRLLAYSSISYAVFCLKKNIAGNIYGYVRLVIYLLVFTLMNLCGFGNVIRLRRRGII